MFLRVLAAQMGVGGDDSWMSPVHEQYQLPADQPLNLDVALDLFQFQGFSRFLRAKCLPILDFKDREAFVVPQGDFRPHDSQFCLTISQDRATIRKKHAIRPSKWTMRGILLMA